MESGRPAVEPGSREAGNAGHFLLAGGTGGNADGKRFGSGSEEDGRTGEDADAFAVADGGGVHVTIIANGAQAAWEHVAQVSCDELAAGDGFGVEAFFVAVFPEKRDGFVGEGNDALVADDAAGDISAEIPKSVRSRTGCLNVNAPIFRPDGGIDLPAFDFEEAAKVLPESSLEEGEMDEVVRLFDADHFAKGVECVTTTKTDS